MGQGAAVRPAARRRCLPGAAGPRSKGRPRAAVKLAAYSEALYAARGEERELNETLATQRALALAGAALDAATLQALQAQGRRLRDAEVAALAFGKPPAAGT
jgi:hypothetical protein